MPQVLRESANIFVVIGSAAMLFIMGCSITLLYWGLVDTQYPIAGVTGSFKGWDKNNPNIARVEWTGERYRYCDAKVDHWFFNNGKPVMAYTTDRVVDGLDYLGKPGETDTIYDDIEVPHEIRNNLINPKYRIRFRFECNLLNKVSPIVVAPPEISLTEKESSGDEANGVQPSEPSP